MALPSLSTERGTSSPSMTGRGVILSTAVSLTTLSLEYSFWLCSAHIFICLHLPVMISPKAEFKGTILVAIGPKVESLML